MMDISKALKRVRFEKGMKQIEVAESANITQTYLSQIESGGKFPTQKTLNSLCKVYGISPFVLSWLATEEKDIPKNKKKIFSLLKPTVDELIKEFLLK